MGARFDRLRCEVFQNLFLSPMNTGFVRPAVATVLTVYGIETQYFYPHLHRMQSQQYLPFTVLKPCQFHDRAITKVIVATVLTVYGIETRWLSVRLAIALIVATVLTVYGIETYQNH